MKKGKVLLTLLGLAMSAAILGGCSGGGSKEEKFVDYVNDGSVSLKIDYKNKDFFTDGVTQVSLYCPIDGDTAHFTPLNNKDKTIKSRFYGIDTPESTGKVQEYGKGASKFTTSKLKEANEHGTIVVSASTAITQYNAPKADSTGSRYLSLIWISLDKQNCPFDELVCLNLWIVQDGWTWVKNVSDIPLYKDTFDKASKQAQDKKLHLFSGEPDPDFNYGGYQDVSLLDLKYEMQRMIREKDTECKYDNMNVRFTGVVVGFTNHTLYVEEYYLYDKDNPSLGGEYASINIFCGMSDPVSKYTTFNTYLSIVGHAEYSEVFGFQINGVQGHFPSSAKYATDTDVQVLIEASKNTEEHKVHVFDMNKEQLDTVFEEKDLSYLNFAINVTEEVTIGEGDYDFYINDNNVITLRCKDVKLDIYITFAYRGNPSNPLDIWKTKEKFAGHTFRVKGVYCYHTTSSGNVRYQVIPSGDADLVFVR